jgi:circadian clock protein KaiC
MSRIRAESMISRLSTGVAGLDAVLGGGIPSQSITVVAGQPGTGKTVLALQMVCEAARAGLKCLYFTTLSEPALKLIRFMQLFEFFDAQLLDKQIVLADLGSSLRAEGAEATLAELTARVEAEEPGLVVVDSFKALHDLIDRQRRRTFVYELAVTMAGWGATTLLLGEYTDEEIAQLPEFAIADGILRLGTVRAALASVRELEVKKLRGSTFIGGVHFFDITAQGIDFVPRVRAPEIQPASPAATATRVSTGLSGLDALLRGGWPSASTTVVTGGTGTGKTILALAFLVDGARRGEPGVLLALEETPDQIRAAARGFGWELDAFEAQGLISIHYTAPIEISTDRFLHTARQLVASTSARRLVLDSLSSLSLGAITDRRFREIVYALTKHLSAAGVTAVMNLEVAELLGSARLSGHGMSFAADNILYLRYVESAGRLGRALTVIKARGIEHGSELCEMVIDHDGVTVGGPLKNLMGALTGRNVQDGEHEPTDA